MNNFNPPAKTAKGIDGRTIRIGSSVVSRHGVKGTVQQMWRAGQNGTIVRTDTAPDPRYPHHHQGAARYTYRADP